VFTSTTVEYYFQEWRRLTHHLSPNTKEDNIHNLLMKHLTRRDEQVLLLKLQRRPYTSAQCSWKRLHLHMKRCFRSEEETPISVPFHDSRRTQNWVNWS